MVKSDQERNTTETTETTNSSVSPIVDSFAGKISKRLEEKERAESAHAQESQARYHLIMQSLTLVRKAFQEACKIRLGDRFTLRNTVSDSEGWPKITLQVHDILAPGWNELFIQAHANDRLGNGLVTIENQNGERILQLAVSEGDPMQRLPIHLKKALRSFLDQVGSYVLDPRRPEDLLSTQTKEIDSNTEEQAASANPAIKGDVFHDHPLPRESSVETPGEPAPLLVDIFSSKKS